MRRGSAIALIRRGIAAKSSHELGTFTDPFTFLCSSFHNVGHKDDRPFASKPRTMRPQPSVDEFAKLLNVIVKMKNYSVALSLFDEMRELGAPVNDFFKLGYKPNVTTFNTLIKGLFLDDKLVEAEKLFEKLLSQKLCEPNDVTILTVINGLCKAGHTVTACYLLRVLEKTRCQPNVKAYNAFIDSLCKDGMVDDALQLVSKMTDQGISPTVVTYSAMIMGLCNFGRWKEVTYLLNEMVDHKVSPNVITFNILVDAFCKEGKVKEAEDVVEIMMQRNVCKDIWIKQKKYLIL
ncbi:hypothetical protein Pfo_026901 [Paulownia fortunei]|nr:hypothetical protein Pfo_026901 [Paulownia fortunei]